MFRKEKSSCLTEKRGKGGGGGGGKNSNNKNNNSKQQQQQSNTATMTTALDVALRKSDVRNVRKRVEDFLLGSSTSGDDAKTQTSTIISNVLDYAFVAGKVQSRHLHHAELGSITLYLRTPDDESSPTDPSNDDGTLLWWPYSCIQVLWIEQESKKGGGKKKNKNDDSFAVPTLALLSTLPPMVVPTVEIPSVVSKYLCRGAHLMKSGMLNLPDDTFDTGGVVAICVKGNPQPMAVGLLNVAASDEIGPNAKGVGVSIWTCYGDDLWLQQQPTTSQQSQGIYNPYGGAPYNNGHYGNVGFLQGEVVAPIVAKANPEEDGKEEKGEDQVDAEQEPTQQQEEQAKNANDGEQSGDIPQQQEQKDEKEVSEKNDQDKVPPLSEEGMAEGKEEEPKPDDNDDGGQPQMQENQGGNEQEEQDESKEDPSSPEAILHQAVCRALLSLSNKQYPIRVAEFYSQHVLPNSNQTIQLKQTKYKKFSRYLLEQVDRDLLTLGPDASAAGQNKKNKGQASDPIACITRVNRKHDDLIAAKKQMETDGNANANNSNNNNNSKKKLVLVQLYIVPQSIRTLLRLDPDMVNATNASSKERQGTGMLTTPEIRKVLESYIEREELVDVTRPDQVQLDGPLHDALYKKGKKKTSETDTNTSTTTLPRKDIVPLWVDRMDSGYCLVEMPGSRVLKLGRGTVPKVTIEVTMRQSKKFVTFIRGLEEYNVHPSEFSKDVSRRFACSASIDDDPPKNSKRAALPKKGHVELTFQGNLVDELEALLLGDSSLTSHGGAKDSPYGLPKNSIDVILRKGVPPRKKPNNKKKK